MLLLILLFVIIPMLIQRFGTNLLEGKLKKWPDMQAILQLFGRIPQMNFHFSFVTLTNYHVALFFGIIFLYLSHTMSSEILEILSLLSFAYIAHLYQDELFDTFWNSIVTLFSFFIIFNLFSDVIHFVFIETDWNIIWRNRRTLLVGPNFVDPATGHEIWRLWPPFYFLMAIIGAAYGLFGEKKSNFLLPYSILAVICIAFLWQEEEYYSNFRDATVTTRNYDPVDATLLLIGGFALGAFIFLQVIHAIKMQKNMKLNISRIYLSHYL